MDIITGNTGTKHITPEKDRDINIGICGEESYVLQTGMKLSAEVASNNEIRIRDGVIMHQGCAAAIKKNTYDSVPIINGSQGMKRIDVIVARYEKNEDTGVESVRLLALQGEPAESNPAIPACVTGDIQSGDNIADMELYRVEIDGLNIVEVKKVFTEVGNLVKMQNQFTELNSKLFPGIDVSNTISSGSVNSSSSTDVYTATNDCWLRVRGSDTISIGIKTASDFAVLFSGSDSNIKTYIMPLKKGQTARGIGNFEWRAYGVL